MLFTLGLKADMALAWKTALAGIAR